MASSDEYQQMQFWEKTNDTSICVESNDKGECLMSAQFVIIDISKPFCEQVKRKKLKNDTRTI
jgi:hypothetical protein